MFGPPGYLYVYRSYGLHWCVNIVTGTTGTASAVLLRAAHITADDGDYALAEDRGTLLRGPGNLTRGLGITGADNGVDCCQPFAGRISFQGSPNGLGGRSVGRSARIGISRARERLSRYFLEGHPAVSRNPSPAPTAK